MRDGFQIWVDAVCEQVRFRPDRKAIARELRVHYEDHYQDLLRLNCAPELAEQRALSAMGNAQEVGWALDRVHKPWLGWLWEGSRVLAVLLAVVLALASWSGGTAYGGVFTLLRLTQNQMSWTSPPLDASHVAADYLDLWLAPGEVELYQDLGGTDSMVPNEERVQAEFTLWIKTRGVTHYNFGFLDVMRVAVDGREIPYSRYYSDDPLGENRWSGYWKLRGYQRGWTRCRVELLLVLDSPPQRVELSCPWTDWVLAAEWEAEP